jgi:hypothetical protein
VLGIGAAPGCFAPHFESGKFACAAGDLCPSGFYCSVIDGRCWRTGEAPAPDGGGPLDPDASVDMAPDRPPGTPPMVIEAAIATLAPVPGTSATLTVAADDDGGRENLTYTWDYAPRRPMKEVAFTNQSSNIARTTTALFPVGGLWTFTVTIMDRDGMTATSTVDIDVPKNFNDLALSPSMASVPLGGMRQFTASAFDQFGDDIALPSNLIWRVIGGCGTVNNGLFVGTTMGTCLVTASSPPETVVTATVSVGTEAPIVRNPIIDAYVQEGEPTTNFGGAATLQVKTQPDTGNTRISYLRFSLANVPADLNTVTLRLFGRADGGTHQDSVYVVADNTWTETGITWRNKPALGVRLFKAMVTTAPKYHEWTITDYVNERRAAGDQVINLAVQMDVAASPKPDTFEAKETATENKPQLVLTP